MTVEVLNVIRLIHKTPFKEEGYNIPVIAFANV